MRTTLELPEDLFRKVKAKAAMKGITLKELLTRYVEGGLRQPESPPSASGRRSKLPVIKRRGKKNIADATPELQAKLDEENDFAKLRRSFGR